MSDFPKRIVCVDDDQNIRNLVRDSLERSEEDIILVTCGSGQELISRLRELQPDLLLLDLVMPDMDGPTTIENLLKEKDDEDIQVPIILLTGKDKVVMLEHYKSLGVIGVIHKPFDATNLTETIAELWQDGPDNKKEESESPAAGDVEEAQLA